jgi:hypothetical protein
MNKKLLSKSISYVISAIAYTEINAELQRWLLLALCQVQAVIVTISGKP